MIGRLFGLGFWLCLLVGLGLVSWRPDPPSGPEASLREGVELLRRGENGRARGKFLDASRSGDSTVAGAAFHNLGFLALERALQEGGEPAEVAAREAVYFSETALRLSPGSEDTAWNLELALRRLDRIAADGGARKEDSRPGSRSGGEQEESTGGRPAAGSPLPDIYGETQLGDGPVDPGDEEAAIRLLASFRLQEEEAARDALRGLLAASRPSTPRTRRGPPW